MPRGGTTDASTLRSGPTSVPTPAIVWQAPHAIPLGEFRNSSFPRSACFVMGLLCAYTETSPAAIAAERVTSRRITHRPFRLRSPLSGILRLKLWTRRRAQRLIHRRLNDRSDHVAYIVKSDQQ